MWGAYIDLASTLCGYLDRFNLDIMWDAYIDLTLTLCGVLQ